MASHEHAGGGEVQRLVMALTDKRNPALGLPDLDRLKRLCRADREAVPALHHALLQRMRDSNPQVQVLALESLAYLASRSTRSRSLLAQDYRQVLAVAAGPQATNGRGAAARNGGAADPAKRCLELAAELAAEHGTRHREFMLGYVHLRDRLKLSVPPLPAPAASRIRHSAPVDAGLADRHRQLLAQARDAITQTASNLADVVAACAAAAEVEQEEDAGEWETVDAGVTGAQPVEMAGSAPALPAFDPDRVDVELVGPALVGLQTAAARLREEWLPNLRSAQALEAVAGGGLAAVLMEVASDAQALLRAADDPRLARVAARCRQVQAPPHSAVAVESPALARRVRGRVDTQPSPMDPYKTILDPAAPRREDAVLAGPSSTQAKAPGRQTRVGAATPQAKLSEEVRRRLVAQAPQLPSGLHTQYWDTGSATGMTSGTAEVYNHWGAVDVSKELPKDRLESVFMVPEQVLRRATQSSSPQRSPPPKGSGTAALDSGAGSARKRARDVPC